MLDCTALKVLKCSPFSCVVRNEASGAIVTFYLPLIF